MLMPAHNLSQTTADTIANDCASETARGNKTDARQAGILDSRRAKHQQFAAPHQPVSFYAPEFGRPRQAALLWK
jgi:hypothetical protein